MFKFSKQLKSNQIIKAPISGKCISIEDVLDEVFSTKMLGDGIAIDATGDTVYAPADGMITTIVNSKHAFGIELDNGLEMLIHIGLETVKLNGEGFSVLVNVNEKVKQGAPLIKIDRDFIQSKGMTLVTPVVILNTDKYDIHKYTIGDDVIGGKSIIMECKTR